MILLSQWYEPSDESRLAELWRARDANEQSGLFDDVVYLAGGETGRLSFGDFLSFAAKNYEDKVCVIANTDIEFDDTAIPLKEICKPNRIVSLTRWDTPASPRMLGHIAGERFFSGTQDSWAIVGGGLPSEVPHIRLGSVGCENAFLGWAVSAGCEVFDPALDIKTWHIHESSHRAYGEITTGKYAYPELTGLIGTGLVLCHDWPTSGSELEMEAVQTCRQ